MAKGKLSTPDWIRKGYDSKEAYEKKKGIKNKKREGKTYKIKKCPECSSADINVILTGEEGKGKGEWECKKCKWIGKNIVEEELNEDEFLIYLDAKGEEVA